MLISFHFQCVAGGLVALSQVVFHLHFSMTLLTPFPHNLLYLLHPHLLWLLHPHKRHCLHNSLNLQILFQDSDNLVGFTLNIYSFFSCEDAAQQVLMSSVCLSVRVPIINSKECRQTESVQYSTRQVKDSTKQYKTV